MAGISDKSASAVRDMAVIKERLGENRLSQNDNEGALLNLKECLNIREELLSEQPKSAIAHRDHWACLSKLARIPQSGVSWKEAAAKGREMYHNGILLPKDLPQLRKQETLSAENDD